MLIRPGTQEDIESIMNLIRSCVIHMESKNIYQWDKIYPDKDTIIKDIEKQELHILEESGRIYAFFVINEFQSPEYSNINWTFSGKVLVLHRLCVDPLMQGKGLAKKLMLFAHEFAQKHGYKTIRLDAFTKNPSAVALYTRLGYSKVGTVVFRKGPFFCFEIQLKKDNKLD